MSAGHEHALDRRGGDDRDRRRVVRPRRALHDARVLAELAPHLLDDLAADAADGRHRQRGEEERHHPADEQAGDDPRVGEVERHVQPFVREPAHVLVEQDQGGEARRPDRVALRDGLRRVADRVERVGHPAHRLRHVRHLGDAAGVVGDGPVRVERDDQAGHRELRHHGDADAVDVRLALSEAHCVVRADDARGDHEHRKGRRLHAEGEPGDDVRRVAGRRRLGDLLHRVPARARVVLGDRDEQERDRETDQGRDVELPERRSGRRRTPASPG